MIGLMPTSILSRFGAQSSAMEVIAGHDLTGKTVLVTGASSGIGVETARALASAGATLILGVRNIAAGENVARNITDTTGNERIIVGRLDLSDFASVRAFAVVVSEGTPALDLLINNAGISQTPETHQADGYELRFATNHLGHFLLFNLLVDRLLAAEHPRVVVLSSAAHKGKPIDFDDIHFERRTHAVFDAYGESKTANALFALELSRRFGDRGLFANAVMPGTIITGLQRYHDDALMRAIGFLQEDGTPNPIAKSAEQGAATTIWAAIAPELDGKGGLILENCATALPAGPDLHPWSGYEPHVYDAEAARRLWEVSEAMIARQMQPLG